MSQSEPTEPIFIPKFRFRYPDRRRTLAGKVYHIPYPIVAPRPTENAVMKHEAGDYSDDEEAHPLVLTASHRLKRQCLKCRRRQPDDHFEPDKRFPLGLSFYCSSCRDKVTRKSWRERRREQIKIVPIFTPVYSKGLSHEREVVVS